MITDYFVQKNLKKKKIIIITSSPSPKQVGRQKSTRIDLQNCRILIAGGAL